MFSGNNDDTLFQLSINAQWKQALPLYIIYCIPALSLPTCGTPRDQYRMNLPRCQIVQINSPDVLILYVTYIQSDPDQMHRVKISSSPDSALRSMFNIIWQLAKPTHLILCHYCITLPAFAKDLGADLNLMPLLIDYHVQVK